MRHRQVLAFAGSVMMVLTLCWLSCVHYTPLGQVGLQRNVITGEVVPDRPGFNVSPPWVQVAKVDIRPVRVCITSATKAVNCRLVQFQLANFEEFIDTEGFRYYWWSNRISFNGGYDEEYRGFRDIMRGYAFAAKKYSFVEVTMEYE